MAFPLAMNPAATKGHLNRPQTIAAYLFLLPTLIGFLVFILGPMVAAIVLSLFKWNLIRPPEYIGLDNYAKLFADPRLGTIYLTTFRIALNTVAAKLLLGLVIAVLLDQKLRPWLRNFFRLSFFFPYVVSVTAVALMWSFLLNKDLGLVNYFLGLLGVERISWLNSSAWSWISIIITDVWKDLGFYVVVFVAGLQSVPHDLYEAAAVDGANKRQQFFRITLPLLTPTILFLSVIGLIASIQIFAQPYILTQGGPGDASRTIVMYIYEQGFRFFDMGYASTVALSLFVSIFVLTLCQFWVSKRWVFYQ